MLTKEQDTKQIMQFVTFSVTKGEKYRLAFAFL
jgi:hypothetical protein